MVALTVAAALLAACGQPVDPLATEGSPTTSPTPVPIQGLTADPTGTAPPAEPGTSSTATTRTDPTPQPDAAATPDTAAPTSGTPAPEAGAAPAPTTTTTAPPPVSEPTTTTSEPTTTTYEDYIGNPTVSTTWPLPTLPPTTEATSATEAAAEVKSSRSPAEQQCLEEEPRFVENYSLAYCVQKVAMGCAVIDDRCGERMPAQERFCGDVIIGQSTVAYIDTTTTVHNLAGVRLWSDVTPYGQPEPDLDVVAGTYC